MKSRTQYESMAAGLDADIEARRSSLTPPFALPGVVLACGSDLTPEPVEWLWPYWLALGKVHILAGAPGQGKTTIAVGSVAATVTIGGRWPDGTHCEPGNVVVWSGEDDPADTLLPRFLAAGGDRSRIFFVQGTRDDGGVHPFDPARDMPQLVAAIREVGGAKLVIVDPVVSAVTGDSHKNTEVRRALQPLVDAAAESRFAVLGISHFSKGGQGQDPTQRVIGSVAFAAVARVVLVAAKVKDDEGNERRILARSKSNIGPDDGGFEYHLEQFEALPGIEASRVLWGKAVEGTARDLLQEPEPENHEGEAVEMLRAELSAECWTESKTASKPLRAAGLSQKQIWTASKRLNIVRKKGGMTGAWYWRLPGGSDPAIPVDSKRPPEDSTSRNMESSKSSGQKWNLRERSHSEDSRTETKYPTAEDSTEGSEDSEDSNILNTEPLGVRPGVFGDVADVADSKGGDPPKTRDAARSSQVRMASSPRAQSCVDVEDAQIVHETIRGTDI